jgi:hypothetical protein
MRALLASAALAALSCGPGDPKPACPEGQVRRDGACTDYVAGDPVPGAGVWRPPPHATWQWQLTGAIDSTHDVEMYDVDLVNATDAELASLSGRTLVCYFSAGSREEWRPDAALFPPQALGRTLEGWEDERWLDVTSDDVRAIMLARLDLAVERGCDGVEPDNMDGYANRNGVGLNATEQLDYNRFIADAAHARGLSVGLKNDVDQLAALEPWFDWALNEECESYDECDAYASFWDAGKAVFHVEYVDDWADAPSLASRVCGLHPMLSTLVKTWDLGPELLACD